MKLLLSRFNIILAMLLLVTVGCKSSEEKKKAKEASFLRFHVESNVDGTRHNSQVTIYRADPMILGVEINAALDEGFMDKVELVTVDDFGNYAIKVTFNEQGAKRLDYVTSSYKGRRLAVQARWTETRWLAAPLITKRITNGVFIFTPDASREEAERIVSGLKNVIAKLKKPYTLI
jgi:preprotein translocase subunit SecD